MKLPVALVGLAAIWHCASAATIGAAESGANLPGRLLDIGGVIDRPFEDREVRAVVFIFITTDCPISNSYLPELNRIQADYGPRGVRLFPIQGDPQLSIQAAREHARAHQIRLPVVLDARHLWARKAGATITPEAAALSPAEKVLYIGRIDNR